MPARKRRQYATGSVHHRARDGRWVGTIEAGWTTKGTRRRITVTARTESECKRRLAAKQHQTAREGLGAAGAAQRTTVKAWATEWLEHSQTRLRPKTYATNASAVSCWIVPTIGAKRLDTLTPGDVRAVTQAIRTAGRSTSTAQRAHVVLAKMLRDALVEGHSIRPALLAMEAPGRAAHDRAAIPVADALAIMAIAAELPHGSRWVAALLQGMRQGECLGLTWDALDLDRGLVDVSWQLQPLPYADRAAGTFRVPDGYECRRLVDAYHLVRPKTHKGQRIIPLVPWMTSALTAWRDVAPKSVHGLVWPTLAGGPAGAKADLEEWKALQCTAEVGHPAGRYYVLHEARHTTATLLLEADVDVEVIKAILGHSSVITSRGYQHVSQVMARDAMERLATRLQLRV